VDAWKWRRPTRLPETELRRRRRALGYTQQSLADAVGTARQTINALENRRSQPNVALALALARALFTTVEELFGDPELAAPDPPRLPWWIV
jgi:putative transcriptional regulator